VPPEPVSPDPGPYCPDWMDDPAYLAMRAADEDPGDLDLEDPDDDPPPDADPGELAAEAARIACDQERAAAVMAGLGLTAAMAADAAAAVGRRGPGMPGSAESFPGVYSSRASGFASGMPLDVAPGCLVLGQFAEEAAGEDDRYPGASDDELAGAIAAWDRVEAYASSRKHAAVAELIRRRPGRGCAPAGPAQMPEAFDEFTPRELASVLGESRAAAEDMLSLAHELEVNLPGTRAAFRAGVLNQRKTAIIASATALLDPEEARAAEAMVLGRGGALTPPLAGVIPPGFAGHVTLTIPQATLAGRADRPGELGGIGPVDPDLARDLAAAAARNPRSTWCVTVTDRIPTVDHPVGTAVRDRADPLSHLAARRTGADPQRRLRPVLPAPRNR
jgi:hypothetical protein